MAESVFGRPVEYKPEYCQMLIDHMKTGLSYEAFAAVVMCCKKTLYNWEKQYPEFLHAKSIGQNLCRMHWENLAINNAVSTNGKSLNASVWIFNMKNRFRDEWRDRQEVENIGTQKIEIKIDKDDSEL